MSFPSLFLVVISWTFRELLFWSYRVESIQIEVFIYFAQGDTVSVFFSSMISLILRHLPK